MFSTSPRRGFTLVELLLVIANIGVLSSIVLVAVNPQQQLEAARNAERRVVVRELRNAIDQYIVDHDAVPPALLELVGEVPICKPAAAVDAPCANLDILVELEYLTALPVDPTAAADSEEVSIGYAVALDADNRPTVTHVASTPPTPVPFSPSQIAGLALWLDASDTATLFNEDRYCEGPLIIDEEPLRCWKDKSGYDNHVTNPNGSSVYSYHPGEKPPEVNFIWGLLQDNFTHEPWNGFTASLYGYHYGSPPNDENITLLKNGALHIYTTMSVLAVRLGMSPSVAFDLPPTSPQVNRHYVFRYDPEATPTFQLFIDGQPSGSAVELSGTLDDDPDLQVGAENAGTFGEFHLFSEPVADADIAALHEYLVEKDYDEPPPL
jgi:prepilin-type N-terminal cleavage/methylation domain-containing protein